MSYSARILVVEDDPKMANFICFKLNYMGYEVVGQATTAAQAIHLARQLLPDLILMDILLEKEDDGIEAAHKILTFADIPIVFLTAYEDEELFQRAKITKPFGYLIKPFNDRDLTLVIETATYRQQQKTKLARALEDARNIINSSLNMIISVNEEHTIIEFNEAAEWQLGYPREEAIGKSILDLIVNKEDLAFINEKLKKSLTFEMELQFMLNSDEEKTCQLSVSRLHDSHKNHIGILLISH
ncbi:response regulator [bacterium]|nr:response regulator [bacterium]